ncbi:MAG: circadian clock protein KaiB [Acidobacteriota bacterium]|nr:circadian clock protein KaiB [Acidobacteriota bacterium]
MSAEIFSFRLYVAGKVPNSLQAIANLTALCEEHLPGRHVIEIVDVFLEPARALTESIFMTPTLVSLSPFPGRKIVGNLSQTEPILQILGLGPGLRRNFSGLKERLPAENEQQQVRGAE